MTGGKHILKYIQTQTLSTSFLFTLTHNPDRYGNENALRKHLIAIRKNKRGWMADVLHVRYIFTHTVRSETIFGKCALGMVKCGPTVLNVSPKSNNIWKLQITRIPENLPSQCTPFALLNIWNIVIGYVDTLARRRICPLSIYVYTINIRKAATAAASNHSRVRGLYEERST